MKKKKKNCEIFIFFRTSRENILYEIFCIVKEYNIFKYFMTASDLSVNSEERARKEEGRRRRQKKEAAARKSEG